LSQTNNIIGIKKIQLIWNNFVKICIFFKKEVYMINILWAYMIVISIIFALLTGRMREINEVIFSSLQNTTEMVIYLTAIMCFWCGMIKILKNTKMACFFNKILMPFINYFFHDESDEAKEFISFNIFSNLMGIGNAATPSGINAMKEMNKSCSSDKMNRGMNMFILLNTLSIQLFPTTIIGIMMSLGGVNSAKIIFPIWIVSFSVLLIIMILGNFLLKKENNDD